MKTSPRRNFQFYPRSTEGGCRPPVLQQLRFQFYPRSTGSKRNNNDYRKRNLSILSKINMEPARIKFFHESNFQFYPRSTEMDTDFRREWVNSFQFYPRSTGDFRQTRSNLEPLFQFYPRSTWLFSFTRRGWKMTFNSIQDRHSSMKNLESGI